MNYQIDGVRNKFCNVVLYKFYDLIEFGAKCLQDWQTVSFLSYTVVLKLVWKLLLLWCC